MIKNPLVINIFWHNANEEMYNLGKKLYGFFLRNPLNPLDRHLGIAVKLFPYIPTIKELQLKHSQNSANIILVDYEMNLSESWGIFFNRLLTQTKKISSQHHRIFPVAIDENVHGFTKFIQQINFINLFEIEENRKYWYLCLLLTHEICRLLYEQKRATKARRKSTNAPIKLFLSHAKKDGIEIAKNLRSHIHLIPGLDSFFDASSISSGLQFSKELELNVKKSILVAIHTDEYSSREWCRKEVLLAKKYDRPVIVVNQLDRGELRSFPYIGNVPHINIPTKWEESHKVQILDLIVLEALREALKIQYNLLKIKCLSKAFNKKVKSVISYPPELMTLTNLQKTKDIILYPDPPLGQEELNLLKILRPNLDFITPTSLPLISNKGNHLHLLKNLKIAILLSEVNDSEKAWIQNLSIQDLMVEITKYLLISGVQLIYSGRIDYKPQTTDGFNFSQLLIELVKTHQYSYEDVAMNLIRPIINYLFYPVSSLLTTKIKSNYKNLVIFKEVTSPSNLKLERKGATKKEQEKNQKKLAEDILEYNTFDKKYVWAKSLTSMRVQTVKTSNAVIALGGKWINFKGKIPGLLEEIVLSLKNNKPLYLIGGLGGVTEEVINALKGEYPKKLKLDFYKSTNKPYVYFIQNFNKNKLTNEDERVDYEEIVSFLNETGKSKTSAFGLNNGLSKKDNELLFKSQNEIEIISLILKGLKNVNIS